MTDLVPQVQLIRVQARLEVQPRQPVYTQDRLETEKRARVRLELLDGSIVNLGPRSRFTLAEMDEPTQKASLLLTHGRLRAEVVRRTRAGGEFVVRTRTAVVGVIGTMAFVAAGAEETFVANLSRDFTARISVRSTDPAIPELTILKPGYGTRVSLGAPPDPPRLWEKERIELALDDSREFRP
ncbi:MAG: FecR domain-containing protein [Acidobacteria bacterium]|nr:FecR domain-containing protein [Acidobacteriota bacterium]